MEAASATTIPPDLLARITAEVDSPSPPHILMLGDSIDRNVVNSICIKYGMNFTNVPHIQITPRYGIPVVGEFPLLNLPFADSVRYGDGTKQAGAYCHLNNTSPPGGIIAFVHILGSDNGPYFEIKRHDTLVPTKARIRHVLSSWPAKMPEAAPANKFPDKIFFNTVNWDLRKAYVFGGIHRDSVKEMAAATAKFRMQVRDDLTTIRMLVGQRPDISLRTSPHSDLRELDAPATQITTGDLTLSWNAALRDMAQKYDLSFFDYENFVWELGRHNFTRVRNELYYDKGSHPHHWISTIAGQIITESIESMYYRRRKHVPIDPAHDPLLVPPFPDKQAIRFGAGQRQIYIYSAGNANATSTAAGNSSAAAAARVDKKNVLRPVNNWGAFVSHGYDLDDVLDIDFIWLQLIPLGADFA